MHDAAVEKRKNAVLSKVITESRTVRAVAVAASTVIGPNFHELVAANHYSIIFGKPVPDDVMQCILKSAGIGVDESVLVECRDSDRLQRIIKACISEAQLSGRTRIKECVATLTVFKSISRSMLESSGYHPEHQATLGETKSGKKIVCFVDTNNVALADMLTPAAPLESSACEYTNGIIVRDEDDCNDVADCDAKLARAKPRLHARYAALQWLLVLGSPEPREYDKDGTLRASRAVRMWTQIVGKTRSEGSSSPYPGSVPTTAVKINDAVPAAQEALAACVVLLAIAKGQLLAPVPSRWSLP